MAGKKKQPNRSATRRRSGPRQVELGALTLRHRAVLEADEAAAAARSARDDLIRLALSQGRSVRSIAIALGITRQSVMAIRDVGAVKTPGAGSDPLF